jgi:hypothetical protein
VLDAEELGSGTGQPHGATTCADGYRVERQTHGLNIPEGRFWRNANLWLQMPLRVTIIFAANHTAIKEDEHAGRETMVLVEENGYSHSRNNGAGLCMRIDGGAGRVRFKQQLRRRVGINESSTE